MNPTYHVQVDDNFNFDIDPDLVSELDLVEISKTVSHVLQDNTSYKIELSKADFQNKSYKVKVNHNTYNINIYNALDILIKELGFEIGNSKAIEKITAPMPGLILEINVAVGDEVKENDPLLILEAMKMENIISSPREGIIKTIAVKKADAVEKNQLLIEFE